MSFAVLTRTEPGPNARDATIYVLQHGTEAIAEIWPALGFNCIHWRTTHRGEPLVLLYDDPNLFGEGRPTRSGIPILFPFPNRIRDGRFTWDGKTYQLPCNDSTGKTAIHGFACQRPWRVVDSGSSPTSAWVTGEFRGSVDAADCVALWPADYQLRVTYRLRSGCLRIEAEVTNPDTKPLPFGLGYHPYFRLPFGAGLADDYRVAVAAKSFWKLDDCLPTGERLPVDAKHDLNQPQRYADLQLDDVLTDVPTKDAKGVVECATIQGPADATLRVRCSSPFRELVVYTPGHRQAFCLEPYTCTTDAVNLQARGIDAGWLVLPPGERWTSVVELAVSIHVPFPAKEK
jgi:aldose 1-epimerase